MSWQRMQNSVEQFVPQTPYEEVLSNDALHGSAPTLPDTEQEKRVYTGGQRTIHELLVLQAAKKEQQDNAMFAGAREKHRNRSDKWAEIEDIVWRNGVKRSGKGCQTKWDSLISDYKKVKDYQKDIPSGQDSYWQMVSSNRKAHKLPLNFFEEVYNALDMWLCQRSSINPSYTVSDTSVLPSAQAHPAVEEKNVEESENAAGYSPPSSINNGNEYSNGRKRQRTPRGSEGLISVMLKSEEAKEWWGKQEAIAMEARKVSYEIAMEGR